MCGGRTRSVYNPPHVCLGVFFKSEVGFRMNSKNCRRYAYGRRTPSPPLRWGSQGERHGNDMHSGGRRCRPSSSIVFCLACVHADFSVRFKSLKCPFDSSWSWGVVVVISWRGLGISSGRSLGVLSALEVPSVEIASSTPILEAILEAF